MRGIILFAAILAAMAVSVVPINGQNSYMNALKHGRAQDQHHQHQHQSSRHSRSPQLHRSNSELAVNRPHNPRYGQQGRSRSVDSSGRDGGCSKNYHVDYMQLTLMWGPGFCATSPKHCVKSENRLFTVHGMWGQIRGQDSPAFCCFDNTFYFKEIEALVPTLNKYWFSYYSQNSRGFWSHEWIKHGTCFRDIPKLQGEQKFFGSTLEIMKRLDILGALKKNGITPGSNKSYSSQQVINAVRDLTGGKSVQLDCDLEAHQPTPLLTGMNLCFDKDLAFIDCPPSKSRCRRDVMFLDK